MRAISKAQADVPTIVGRDVEHRLVPRDFAGIGGLVAGVFLEQQGIELAGAESAQEFGAVDRAAVNFVFTDIDVRRATESQCMGKRDERTR
ncbi:MAG: hypothetical protein IPG43_04705 [Proteobacteria bacterium]|nr:hypothetical protein [Pseudomonadota bacterium]